MTSLLFVLSLVAADARTTSQSFSCPKVFVHDNASFSPDETHLAYGGWAYASEELDKAWLQCLLHLKTGHQRRLHGETFLRWLPDGGRTALLERSGSIYAVNVDTDVSRFVHASGALHFSSDGSRLAVTDNRGAHLLDARTFSAENEYLFEDAGSKCRFEALHLQPPSGDRLLVVDRCPSGQRARLVEWATSTELFRHYFTEPEQIATSIGNIWSPAGEHFVLFIGDINLSGYRVYDQGGAQVRSISLLRGSNTETIMWNPSGTRFSLPYNLFNLMDGEIPGIFAGAGQHVPWIDNEHVFYLSFDKLAKLNVVSGKRTEFPFPDTDSYDVSVAPDGHTVATHEGIVDIRDGSILDPSGNTPVADWSATSRKVVSVSPEERIVVLDLGADRRAAVDRP